MRKLYDHLRPEAAKSKHLPPLSAREKRRRLANKLLQIGVVRTLPLALDPVNDSAEYSIAEGRVEVASVVSEGARHVRLHFKNFSLPAGARVFVYSAANPDFFFGPYEGRGPWNDGTFWTPTLPGDQVVIEYTSPLGSRGLAPFTVSQIAHLYKDTLPIGEPASACNLEVAPPWTEVAKSVGMLQFVTGGLVALCTGTLLNDSNTNIDHYVLTANHCINSQAEAQSAQIFWNYNSGETPGGSSSFGADLKVSGTASDFSLLRFGGVIPGLFYSGWDANPVATSTGVTGIHHPSGSHKRISFGATNANCPSWLGALCPNFTGVTWNEGVTEPGSSGSGIWTGAGDAASSKLVGTLTGGESSCSNPSGSDYYGRFSVTYPNVSAFLNGTNCVTSISPNSQSFPAAGGPASFNITAPAGCSWSASSTAAWLTITSPASGTGNGTIDFSVAASSELQRRGSIVVGTQLFNVNQAGGGVCAPTPINYGQTINGTLATSDCPVRDGPYVDAYSFNGTAGQQISILMTSSAFDTFLILLNPDGSTLRIDDDGGDGTNSRIPPGSGFITLTTAGTYTILATSFWAPGDPEGDGGVGPYSITLNGSTPRTLTVASQNPNSGVTVGVSVFDNLGQSTGTTQFTRIYNQNVSVTLTAHPTTGKIFQEWRKDGVFHTSSMNANVTMDVDHTMTAVYRDPNVYTLTVASSNPNSGVGIGVIPNDNNGHSSGMTQFTRNYNEIVVVGLNAPLTAPGGNVFQKWQRNGVDYDSNQSTTVQMNGSPTTITMIAVYVAPQIFTLTVASSNPNSGVNITVSPNDNGGFGNGATQFSRTYNQYTNVVLTAPAAAGNGNVFDRWLVDGITTFNSTVNVFMSGNRNAIAVYLTKPVIFIEEGTVNTAAALDSVTFLRGPLRLLDPYNFSSDQRTRLILFTSDLGLTQADLSDPAVLVVEVPGLNFPVQNVGSLAGVPGLTGSYIIVRLPDGLTNGTHNLTIRLRGVTSDARTLTIIP